jgi:hypothetical protein
VGQCLRANGLPDAAGNIQATALTIKELPSMADLNIGRNLSGDSQVSPRQCR